MSRASAKTVTIANGKCPPDSVRLLSPEVRAILDDFRLEEVVTHLLRRAHFKAEEMFAQEFAAESITPRQKAALVIIYQQPGLSQNALADRLRMDRNTVAEMIKRLVANGLILRTLAQEDHRAYQLLLAPDGARLLQQVIVRDQLVEQRVLDLLPEEYRALFFKCLRLLVDATAPSNSQL
ncbi:MAG: MarR family transcriptional regulator [Burkholderiaceae bacterium]